MRRPTPKEREEFLLNMKDCMFRWTKEFKYNLTLPLKETSGIARVLVKEKADIAFVNFVGTNKRVFFYDDPLIGLRLVEAF